MVKFFRNLLLPRALGVNRPTCQITFRRGRAHVWATVNPVLLANEIGRVSDDGSFKVGDGTTRWLDLQYADRLPETITMFSVVR